MGDRNWTAVSVCVAKKPAEKMVAVGEEGDVFTYVGGKAVDEAMAPKPVALRGTGVIDGFAMACGMKRQVFRRSDENVWIPMHAPSPAPDENAGFEALCGFGANEVYAVGWNGEIWQWDSARWIHCKSPTNVILTGACCGAKGQVFICGQNGTLIQGRREAWERVALDPMTDDLSDVCWFKDRLYVASRATLFTYSENKLQPVDFGSDRPTTTGRLTEAEGTLWSIGSADIFSFDGTQWIRVD